MFGKGVRNLRKQGILPAVLYGGGKKNIALSVTEQALEKICKSAGESSLVELYVDEKDTENVLIHDVDYNPLTHKPRHVDFLRVRMDEALRVAVPFRFEGESPAVKEGGILVKVMHEAEVEALPANLPHEIVADLSRLTTIGGRLTLADFALPKGVSFVGDSESVAALIEKPRAEEEVLPSESARIEAIEVAGGKKEKKEEVSDQEKAAPRDEPRRSGRESPGKEERKPSS